MNIKKLVFGQKVRLQSGGYGTIATPEEIKQHDEEYRLRLKYWHVLVYVDGMWDIEASECAHKYDMEVIRKHLEPYDLSSMCDLTTTPEHKCTCSGAGIRLR